MSAVLDSFASYILTSPYCWISGRTEFGALAACFLWFLYLGQRPQAVIMIMRGLGALFENTDMPCTEAPWLKRVFIVYMSGWILCTLLYCSLAFLLSSSHREQQIKRVRAMFFNPQRYLRTPEEVLAEDCAVCKEPLRDRTAGEAVQLINCSHQYHRECIAGWLTKEQCCPYCRSKV